MTNAQLKKQVLAKLKTVNDPELDVSLYDLGLIYKCNASDGNVLLTMTLTSIGCPLFETIENDIKKELKTIKGVKKIDIELVFDPPWSIDRLTPLGKALLGF